MLPTLLWVYLSPAGVQRQAEGQLFSPTVQYSTVEYSTVEHSRVQYPPPSLHDHIDTVMCLFSLYFSFSPFLCVFYSLIASPMCRAVQLIPSTQYVPGLGAAVSRNFMPSQHRNDFLSNKDAEFDSLGLLSCRVSIVRG